MLSSHDTEAISGRESRPRPLRNGTDASAPKLDWGLLIRLGAQDRIATHQNGGAASLGSTGEGVPVPLPPMSEPHDSRSCSLCGATQSIGATVREHADCGYISLDIPIGVESDGPPVCPKCGANNGDGTTFDVIGTVHTCIGCGQTLDRPLQESTPGQ